MSDDSTTRAATEGFKSPEQVARAVAQRRANAEALRSRRALPYPNPWDDLDPTKVPRDASEAALEARYAAFRKLCPPPPRKTVTP